MITLYSTNCPKCNVLETKLKNANIGFNISNDLESLMKQGFREAPILEVDNQYLKFSEAIKWIQERGN